MSRPTDAELLARLAECPPFGSRWRHYRGGVVYVCGSALDEATLAPLVLYCHSLESGDERLTFARPLSDWQAFVETEPGVLVPRFRRED